MGTVALWIILVIVGVSKRQFCIDKAKRLRIKVRELWKTRSEPFDFLYDVLAGLITFNIMFIQTKITISLILSIAIFGICLLAFANDLRRLSKKEAE